MKKVLFTLLAAVALVCGLTGCSTLKNTATEPQNSADPNGTETLGPLVWTQVESKVLSLEKALKELVENHEEGLVPVTNEEVVVLVKRVEEAYELVKDGFKSNHEKLVLDFYEAARRLELSGDENVMSLGTAAKDFMLGMLGHTVVEDVDVLHENVTSSLAYVYSKVEGLEPETQENEESK